MLEFGRNVTISDDDCLAHVVDIEQFGRQRVAPVVTLTLFTVHDDSHADPRLIPSHDGSTAPVPGSSPRYVYSIPGLCVDHLSLLITLNCVVTIPRGMLGRVSTDRTLILLPPSEGKAPGGAGPGWDPTSGRFGETLGECRAQIAGELARCEGGDGRLLGVSGTHLERARAANASLLGAPTMPAWQRYTGVVWDHLDLGGLSGVQRRSALGRIGILSGLHGLVTAADPLPDYRLKMGARLGQFGRLSSWWADVVTATIATWARRSIIVDLLPQEHRAAWRPAPQDARRVLRVTFHDAQRGRGSPAIGHDAKAAKGLLARHLLTTTGSVHEALEQFHHERYVIEYDPT